MAVSFQIDAVVQPRDPVSVVWEPKEIVGRAHSGAPIFNIKRRAALQFDDLPFADFNTIAAYDNGATHTVRIPHPTTGAYTSYAGAYIRATRWRLEDINSYDVEFTVEWIEI